MQRPLVTPYEIFQEIRAVYAQSQNLYLRKKAPEITDYRRLRQNLIRARILAPDANYHQRAYRVLKISDLQADDICCLVDPFCYISHMSAMQRYGLSDRRPHALHLSRPDQRNLRGLVAEIMKRDYPENESSERTIPLRVVSHPKHVRGRRIQLLQTKHLGSSIQLRSSFARISTIGQTFLDNVEEPSLCGGMNHVLEVWKEKAQMYLDEITEAVSNSHSSIAKVRAGYILEEVLNISDARIESWLQFAQRGGSRLLDPTKSYAPSYSERWMISKNV